MPSKHYRDPKEGRMVKGHCVPPDKTSSGHTKESYCITTTLILWQQLIPSAPSLQHLAAMRTHLPSGHLELWLVHVSHLWNWMKAVPHSISSYHPVWSLYSVSAHISPSPCGTWLFHGNQRPVPHSHQYPGFWGAGEPRNLWFAQPRQISELSACQHYVVSRMKTEAHSSHPSASGDADTQTTSESVPYASSPADLRTANPFSIGFTRQLCSALLLPFSFFSLLSCSLLLFNH